MSPPLPAIRNTDLSKWTCATNPPSCALSATTPSPTSSTSLPNRTWTARLKPPATSSKPTSSARSTCSKPAGPFGPIRIRNSQFTFSPRFVHVSTDEVFGSLGPTGQFTEASPYAPNSPYSASKAASDLLVRSYHQTYGLDTVITHGSNTYGPRQFPEKLIPLVITRAAASQPIPVYGDGLHVRDWLHVTDHAQALWQALRHGRAGETYCLGGGNEWPNLRLVEHLCDLVDQLAPQFGGTPVASSLSCPTDLGTTADTQ